MVESHGSESDNDAKQLPGSSTADKKPHLSLLPPIPRNRSVGNFASQSEIHETTRNRYSFDASSLSLDYEAITRSPIMTDREHGLGLSGLHRIRQPTLRIPAHASNASSRSPSLGPSRSTSLSLSLTHDPAANMRSPVPQSPAFTEDLSRFPSESLHSFSYAHPSEEYINNRHNVVKRSLEYMKDHISRASSSTAGIASAQARAMGDIEAQTMLELLSKAQLVGASNLPHTALSSLLGPLTGPANISGGNVFENQFVTGSDALASHSPTALTPRDEAAPKIAEPAAEEGNGAHLDHVSVPLSEVPTSTTSAASLEETLAEDAKDSRPETHSTSRPAPLRRTFTDTMHVSLQDKLIDTLGQPFLMGQPGEPVLSPLAAHSVSAAGFPSALGSIVHGHSSRWVPATQAIFTTESQPPWTILAANDLACLVFGVRKEEVRKMGILEVVQKERRAWLEKKLLAGGNGDSGKSAHGQPAPTPAASAATALLGGRTGITAQLLSKPNSRSQPKKKAGGGRSRTVHPTPTGPRHRNSQSRGVLICGDVIPIQKRNGSTGSASLWVKEKRVGLIWVLEEIHEDVAILTLGDEGLVQEATGACEAIWNIDSVPVGSDIGTLIPRIPRQGIDPRTGEVDFAQATKSRYFTCPHSQSVNIPCLVEQVRGQRQLRVSSFPHIAGIIVVSPEDLTIKSSNSAFCAALFGHDKPDGKPINMLIPNFDKTLEMLIDEDGVEIVDGIVVPEHSFRKASVYAAIREGRIDAAAAFLRPEGVPARHRDGSELRIDVQMRVVQSETPRVNESIAEGLDDAEASDADEPAGESECVYALWITYSRHLHSNTALSVSGSTTPLRQPTPGQVAHRPDDATIAQAPKKLAEPASATSTLTQQLREAAWSAAAKLTGTSRPAAPKAERATTVPRPLAPPKKKTIDDFQILEEMGQGAYGQVKLARYKSTGQKVVLKYVTKRRILVDTWTRDRRLGTVPLEIHVLDYLRRPELRNPNIMEMESFFEDDTNYYIEMLPHGVAGMDLFDYIELKTNMDEAECRSIFIQVVRAVHHLHTKALVVHRDIKDENVILDGEGHIKLIDFGSAAYIKSGPFQVFVGTIAKAKPEFVKRTAGGGKWTIAMAVTSAFLVWGELARWWRGAEHHTFAVEKGVSQDMQINMDVVVRMACGDLHINVQDASGDLILAGMLLRRADTQWAQWADKKGVHKLGTDDQGRPVTGAGYLEEEGFGEEHVHDIVAAGKKKAKWPKTPKLKGKADSCRIYGSMNLNKVQGDFHITARGHGYRGTGEHLHHSKFDFSHVISELSFGPFYPSLVNPLDRTVNTATANFHKFQYFLSVVPTVYTVGASARASNTIMTNQYAVTEQSKEVTDHNVPGIFFKYDIEPVLLSVQESRAGLVAFAIKIVNILSGVLVACHWGFTLSDWARDVMGRRRRRSRGVIGEKEDDEDE